MFSARTSFLSCALVVGLGIATVACAAEDASDAPTAGGESSSQDELRANGLTGTYDVGTGTGKPFDFEKLTLNADHTFVASAQCGGGTGSGFHCQSIRLLSGTWSASSANAGSGKIAFKSEGSTTTLFYSVSGPVLRLSATAHGKFSLFLKAGVRFPKVGVGDVCSDKLGNIIAECPDDFACNFDGSSDPLQHCFPDF